MTSETDGPNAQTEPAPDPSQLDEQTIATLKRAGFSKPEGVSWGQWMGPKKLSHRHEVIALMAAGGASATDIAGELKYTDSRMSIILNTPRMQRAISNLREKYFGAGVQQRFTRMLPKAIDVVESVLDNPQAKNADRLKAANELFNRAIGKPKETVEIRSNSIRDIFEYLDQARQEQTFNPAQKNLALERPSPQTYNSIQPKTINAEATLVQTTSPDERKKRADIDAWVDECVPANEGIGKKGSQKT